MQILLMTVFMLWPIPSAALTAWQFRGTPKWLGLSLLFSKWLRYLLPIEDQQVSGLFWDFTASWKPHAEQLVTQPRCCGGSDTGRKNPI